MAIAFARVSIHSRSQGHSAVAAIAYRAALKLVDARTGTTHNYSHRPDVVYTKILLPEHASSAFLNREYLWNQVETAEKRIDAQICKDVVLALPKELSLDLQIELVTQFANQHFIQNGLPADIAIHHHDDGNPHAHILIPTRRLEKEGFARTKARDLNPKFFKGRVSEQERWGENWRDFQNGFFKENNLSLVVDANHVIPERHQGRGVYLTEENQLIKTARQSILINEPQKLVNSLSEAHEVFTLDDMKTLVDKTVQYSPSQDSQPLTRVLEKLQTEEGIFNEKKLKAYLLEHTHSKKEFEDLYTRLIAHEQIISLGLGEDGREHFVGREAFELETNLVNTTQQLAAQSTFDVPRRLVKKVSRQYGLNNSQTKALLHLTRSPNASLVSGYAGTGKTYLLKAAKEIWEKSGYQMIGLSTSGKAASGLQSETGINSYTIYSFISKIKKNPTIVNEKTILIMDEMGMTSLDDMSAVLTIAQKSGAKFTGVGDSEQTQPVGRGAPQRAMIHAIGSQALDEIIRQKTAWQRQATTFLETSQTGLGFDLYVANDCVKLHESHADLMTNAVQAWFTDINQHHDKKLEDFTLTAFKNETVDKLNELARKTLVEKGYLDLGTEFRNANNILSLSTGERLLFTKNDNLVGVRNGDFATIVKINQDKTFHVRLDNGQERLIDSKTYNSFSYGYAATVHKLQGHTTSNCHVVIDGNGWDRHKFLVAATRHKEQLTVHAAKEDFADFDHLKAAVSRYGLNDILTDFPVAFGSRRGLDVQHNSEQAVKKMKSFKARIFDSLGYLFNYQVAVAEKKEPFNITELDIIKRRKEATLVAEFCDNRVEIAQTVNKLEALEKAELATYQNHIYNLQSRNGELAERFKAEPQLFTIALERNRVQPATVDKAFTFYEAQRFVQDIVHAYDHQETLVPQLAYRLNNDNKKYYGHICQTITDALERQSFMREVSHAADSYRRETALEEFGLSSRPLINAIYRYKVLDYEISKQLVNREHAKDKDKTFLYEASIERNRLAEKITQNDEEAILAHFSIQPSRVETHAAKHQDRMLVKQFSEMAASTRHQGNLHKQVLAHKIKANVKQFGPFIDEFLKSGWKEVNLENWHYKQRFEIAQSSPEFKESLKHVRAYKETASLVYEHWQKAIHKHQKGSPHAQKAFKAAEIAQWTRALKAHALLKNIHAHTPALAFEKVDMTKLVHQAHAVQYLKRYQQETRETIKTHMAAHMIHHSKTFKSGLAFHHLTQEVKELARHHDYLKRIKSVPTTEEKTLIRLSIDYQQKKVESGIAWSHVKALQRLNINDKALLLPSKHIRQQRNAAAFALLNACNDVEVLTKELTGVKLNIPQLQRDANQHSAEKRIESYQSASPDEKIELARALLADKSHYYLLYEHKISFKTLNHEAKRSPVAVKDVVQASPVNKKESRPFWDVALINQILMKNPIETYQALLGEPKSRAANHIRYSGGIVVATSGTNAGKWYSFTEETGGNPIAAIQHYRNLSFPETLAYGASLAGIAPIDTHELHQRPAPLTKLIEPEVDLKSTNEAIAAKSIWEGTVKAKGTLAERYFLEHRKLDSIDNLEIRFWPKGATWTDVDKEGRLIEKTNKIPAAVIAAYNAEGTQVSVQRIYLDEKTGGKNTFLAAAKLTKGRNKGAGGLIQQGIKGGRLYIAEGPETAASIARVDKNATVLVSFSVSNIANLKEVIKAQNPKSVYIAADNDGCNSNSLKTTNKACLTLREAGIDARIVMPNALPNRAKTDWNDVLVEKGASALTTQLNEKLASTQTAYELGQSVENTPVERLFKSHNPALDLTDLRINSKPEFKDPLTFIVPLMNSKGLLVGEKIIQLTPQGIETHPNLPESSVDNAFYVAQQGKGQTLLIADTVLEAKKFAHIEPEATVILCLQNNIKNLASFIAEQGKFPQRLLIKSKSFDIETQRVVAQRFQNFRENNTSIILINDNNKQTVLNTEKLEKEHFKKIFRQLITPKQDPKTVRADKLISITDQLKKQYPILDEYMKLANKNLNLSGYFKEKNTKQLHVIVKKIDEDKKLLELIDTQMPQLKLSIVELSHKKVCREVIGR